jgi:multisubunit Na+/H+ antiporter MnhB subunit
MNLTPLQRKLLGSVLLAAAIAVAGLLFPGEALKGTLGIVITIAAVAFGLIVQATYHRFRRPHDAEHAANWKVPGGGWIVLVIVGLVVVLFADLLSVDPLQGPR